MAGNRVYWVLPMEIGIVIRPAVWLYEENRKDVADELLMGWAVGIIKKESDWLLVTTHYGYTGFLRAECVSYLTQKLLRQREESGQTVLVTRAFVDVLEKPDVHSRILVTLCRGSFLTALSDVQRGYRKVGLADGQTGYVPCIAYACRKDSDKYLYIGARKAVFLYQGQNQNDLEQALRDQLVCNAKSYLGVSYRWGGKSAEGIDCSGLTFMCYMMCGILIYRDAKIVDGYPVHQIPWKQLKQGDLLYFPGHIAMYIGHGRYIHATGNEKSYGCVVNSLFEQDWDYRQDLAEELLMAGSVW